MDTWIDARMHSLRALSASVAVAALALFAAPEVAAQPGGGSSSSTRTTTTSPGVGGAGGVPGKMRLNIFGTLGFGGETDADIEYSNDDLDEFDDRDFDDWDMETTNGFGAQFDYALHRYFLLGGRLAFNFAELDDEFRGDSDDDLDRFMLMNIDVVPKGRLPIAGAPIEFYAAVPLGMSFNFPDESYGDEIAIGDTDMNTGVSGNLSVHLGLHYWFNSTIGIMVEQGLYHQQYNLPGHTVIDRGPFDDAESDFVIGGHFNQFSVNVGLSIGL